MVGVFVRLKLRILRNGFRSSAGAVVLFVLGTLTALALGVLAGLGLAQLLGGGAAKGEVLLLVAFPAVWVLWVIGPLLNTAAGDQTADPTLFALLPVSAATQVRGLLVAGLVGPAALGTLLGALGPALSGGTTLAARAALVLVAVVFVVLCVASSKAVAALMSGLANTRRGKEARVVIVGLVAASMYFLSNAATSAAVSLADKQSAGAWDVLAVLPPGALGRSVAAFREGQWLVGVGLLAWGAAGIAIALVVWRWAIERHVLSSGGGEVRGRGPVGDGAEFDLYPAYARWLPRTAVGASTAKELRYYLFRSTLQVQQLLLGTVFAILFAGRSLFSPDPGAMGQFVGAIVLFFVLFQSAPNVFGIDNAAVSGYLLSGVDMRRILQGKLLALLLIGVALGVVLQLAMAATHGTWSELPVGLAALPIPWLVWVGLGSVLSVGGAYPIKAGRNTVAGRVYLVLFGGMFGAAVVLALVAIASILTSKTVGNQWAGIGVGWVLGAAIGWLGLRFASARLMANPTSLLVALGGDKA
ncbi:MAG: hypothetical protein RLZ55_1293 [Actinomycetota bacterium]